MIFAGAAAMALSGCWPFGSASSQSESGSGGGEAQPLATAASPAGVGQEAAPANELTLALWGDDGCLEYLVLDGNNDTVAVSATNLCRASVSAFSGDSLTGPGTFYAYFERGGNVNNWQEILGQGDDGYIYWEYGDGQLYRQLAAGGAAQLAVTYANGQVGFEDDNTYLQQNPKGLPFLQSVEEDMDASGIAKEEIGTTVQRNPQLPGSASAEYSQAQSDISTQDQQAQQIEQTYQGVTQGQVSADQELVKVTQAQQDQIKVLYAKDCSDSDNVEEGCGGANAYNDDGGVGEGDN